MLHGVHSHTTNLGPGVALHTVLVEGTASLEQRLVGTSSTGNNADGGTGAGRHGLLGTRRELDAGLASVKVVGDDGGVVARGTGKLSTVSSLGLNVADNGTLGALSKGQNVADGELGTTSGVDELA